MIYIINHTRYKRNPTGSYALYQSKGGEWKESASITNMMLLQMQSERRYEEE